jgi:hypothetical protein
MEWEIHCPLCGLVGCPSCIVIRRLPPDGQPARCWKKATPAGLARLDGCDTFEGVTFGTGGRGDG